MRLVMLQRNCKIFFAPGRPVLAFRGGCEAIVHATRHFIDNMPADDVMVKLDISNAFNNLHRDFMLRCVAERIPIFTNYVILHITLIRHYSLVNS